MKVLSIDFDYFQKTDIVTVMSSFPAPCDYTMERASFEWMMLYSDNRLSDGIRKVSLMQSEFDWVCKYISDFGRRKPDAPCLIVNSHGALYEFVTEHTDLSEPLFIVNVDMHHDLFGEKCESCEKEVSDTCANCANWGNVLKKQFSDFNMIWVKNPYVSDFYKTKLINDVTIDIQCLDSYDFDMLFICRSDNFLVPHLDPYFKQM